MLFINLKDNKIIKEFKYTTREISAKINFEGAVSETKKAFESALSQIISQDPLVVHYIINIDGEGLATEDEANNFLSIVNVGCIVFFNLLTQTDKREREYRLDVPQSLKNIKVSMSLLKRAVNNKTINDVFNFTIKYKDLFFVLCDENKEVEKGEFIHSVDELEDSNNDATK